jgi:hypothetical protein
VFVQARHLQEVRLEKAPAHGNDSGFARFGSPNPQRLPREGDQSISRKRFRPAGSVELEKAAGPIRTIPERANEVSIVPFERPKSTARKNRRRAQKNRCGDGPPSSASRSPGRTPRPKKLPEDEGKASDRRQVDWSAFRPE